jgi:PAS domain S-box-containing protein
MKNKLDEIASLSFELGETLEFNHKLIEALDCSSEGIAILDKDGKYTWLNKAHAEMFGYNQKELIGESWEVLYNEEDRVYFYDVAFSSIAKNGKWNGEAVGIQKDGTTKVKEIIYLTSLKDGGLICTCIKRD